MLTSLQRNRSAAFTLLEILVAVSLLALLMVLMMGIVTSASMLWRDGENRIDPYREARAAMSLIARDLRSLTALDSADEFLINNSGAFAKLPGAAEAATNRAGALFFLSRKPANAQDPTMDDGELCEVGYYLGFERLHGATNASLNLYRHFRNSTETYANLLGSRLFSDSVIGPSGEEMLARNIRKLIITPLVETNGTVTTHFSPSPEKPHPDWLEISLVAINRGSARKFPDRASWTTDEPPEALRRYEQEFTIRVRLPE